MKNINNITYVGFGPSREQIKRRDGNRICTAVKFNHYGEIDFFCKNRVKPYIWCQIPLASPQEIWISESMICDDCLSILESKYSVDFKREIPDLYMSKGWANDDHLNFVKYNLIVDMKSKIKISSIKKLTDPEIRWWNEFAFLMGIPKYWVKHFELSNFLLRGDKRQGINNGPDYIFNDKVLNKSIGFEIVSYKWNIMAGIKDENYIKKISKRNIFNSKSLDDIILDLKKIIEQKSNKNYIKTDELYLGIVVNNTLMDYQYYILELILNKHIKDKELFLSGIFIL